MTSDGVSVVAVDRSNDRVAGVLINKIHLLGTKTCYTKFLEEDCKTEEGKTIMKMMALQIEEGNLFNLFNVNSVFEIGLGTVLPEYRRNNRFAQLVTESLQLADDVSVGSNFTLPRQYNNYLPKLAIGVSTCPLSLKLCEQNGMKTVIHKVYDIDGRKYSETLSVKKLKGFNV